MKNLCVVAILSVLTIVLLQCASPAQSPKGAAAAPAARAEDQCTVSGTVVKLAGSEPLRKARVRLESMDDPTRSVSVATDASGRFEFRKIEPGGYKLSVRRVGFVAQEYGQRKPGGPGAVLSLRPRKEMKDLVFYMVPSAVIAGKVLDEDGEPMQSVFVSAMQETYSDGKRNLSIFGNVVTNDLGEYRLYGLTPGKYYISAVFPQWGRYGGNDESSDNPEQSQGYAKMFYPGTADRAKATPISVKAGEEIPSTDILMRPVPVFHVRGHAYNQITHKSGTVASIMLKPKASGRDWDFGDRQTDVQKKDGSFDIAEVLPGSYILIAFWFDEGKGYSTRMPLEVGSANVEGVSVTLGPGVTINGQIVWDGRASLEAEELTVALEPSDHVNFLDSDTRVTQNNGFAVKDVGEGTYFVNVNGQSKDCYIKDVRYGESSALDEGFTVTRGNAAALQIVMSPRGARVQGSVADSDSLPAAGVWVVLIPDTSRRGISRLYKSQTTDQYGHFDMRGITPGEYKLFSWTEAQEGSWEDAEFLKPFEEKGETIFVQEGDQKNIKLTAISTKTPEPATP